jgi:hypothetical protein
VHLLSASATLPNLRLSTFFALFPLKASPYHRCQSLLDLYSYTSSYDPLVQYLYRSHTSTMLFPTRQYLPFFLLILSALLDTAAADALDFSLYPANSQSCLYAAASSSACNHTTVPVFNACVCSNGGNFLQSAATCLGSNDTSDVSPVYVILSSNCGDSNTPISYTSSKWKSIAAAAPPSSTTSTGSSSAQTTLQTATVSGHTTVSVVTVTPTSSSSSTAAADSDKSTVGTGAIAGIAVGGAAIAAVVGAALFFFLRRRRNTHASQPEATPFIGPYSGSGNDDNKDAHQLQSYSNFPATQGAEKYGSHQYPSTSHSPAPSYSGQLGYPPQQPYGGEYGAPGSGIYMPPPQNGAVELAGQSAVQNHIHELPTN